MFIISKRFFVVQFIIGRIFQFLSCSSFFQTNNAFNKIYPIAYKRTRWFHECNNECNYAVRSISRSVIWSTTSDSVGQTNAVNNEKSSEKLPLPFMNIESVGISGRWIQQDGNFILKPQFNGSISSSSSINT